MAKAATKKRKPTGKRGTAKARPPLFARLRLWLWRWTARVVLGAVALVLLTVLALRFVPPPTTHTIWSEARRLGGVDRIWVPIDGVAPVMVRSVVAAEDANFCLHWGFDMGAIREAIEEGGQRGASTLTQQTVKNVFLWQGRNWTRKALEAGLTPLVEALWPKRRILEIYLNIAEWDEGVFGIDAAAHRYFGVGPDALTPAQAAALAAILPDPKGRDAANLSGWLTRRARQIEDGAATIRADGRAACFES